MGKINIEREINSLRKKSKTTELIEKDYRRLSTLLNQLKKINDKNSARHKEEIIELLELRENSSRIFSDANYRYIVNNLSIIPLIFANGEFYRCRFCHKNRFKFYYKFDDQIQVFDVNKNRIVLRQIDIEGNKVYSDGAYSNAQYIAHVEGISHIDALKVILGIYNCEYNIDNEKLYPIIDKYKKALISDEFIEFMENGRKVVMDSTPIEELNLDYYDEIENHIKRVKANVKEPSFVYKRK